MDNPYSLPLFSFAITILSLIASLIVIVIHLSVREIRSHFFFRIAFHISFSDLLFSLSSLYIYSPLNLTLCTALGVTRELTWLASIAWTTILPYTIHKSLQESLTDVELDQHKPRYIFFAYIVPVICSVIPAVALKNTYGHSDMYCWISSDHKSEFLAKSLLLYLPVAVSAILTIIWCFRMRRWVKFLLRRSVSQSFIKLLYYPLIMLLCNSGAVAHGLQKEFGDSRGFLWLTSVFLIGRQAQGLLNGLVYVLNNQVRRAVRRKFVRRINRERSNSDGQYDVPFIYQMSASFEDQIVVNTEECYKYFNTKKTMVE